MNILVLLLLLFMAQPADAWYPWYRPGPGGPVQHDVWTPWGMSYDIVYDPWCKMWEENIWTNGMKVWSYRHGILNVSFLPPEWPYPTDWEKAEKEAVARAKKLGYGVKAIRGIEYEVSKVRIRFMTIETKPLPPSNIQIHIP